MRNWIARLSILAVLVSVGFAYGFATDRYRLPPYELIRSAFRFVRGLSQDASYSGDHPSKTRAGVSEGLLSPEAIEGLKALGYLQGYEAAPERSGVVFHDPSIAFAGLNFYVSGDAPEARLITMTGDLVHSWHLSLREACPRKFTSAGSGQPGTSGKYWRRAHLLPNGELIAVFDYEALIRVDRNSRLLWARCDPFHHDLSIGPDGRIYTLSRNRRFVTWISDWKPILDDVIEVLDADGSTLQRVSILDALEQSSYAPHLQRLEKEHLEEDGDILHTNAIKLLDGRHTDRFPQARKGNVLVSIRHLDLIAIVDMELERVVWAISGMWRYQHEPVLIDNGNLLVFDNLGFGGKSRVLEIDPATQSIVWSYSGDGERELFSVCCGSQQRLPNGNTLVVESTAGRAIEVTSSGAVAWEFVSPHRVGEGHKIIALLPDLVRIGAEPFWLSD